MTDAKQVAYSK